MHKMPEDVNHKLDIFSEVEERIYTAICSMCVLLYCTSFSMFSSWAVQNIYYSKQIPELKDVVVKKLI